MSLPSADMIEGMGSITILIAVALLAAMSLAAGAADVTMVTVGLSQADVIGGDSTALQKGADEVARRAPSGGGVLLIKAGEYVMYDSLHIRVPMAVRGDGGKTILKKCPQFRTKLVEDFDISEYVLKVADPSGLRVGMGITIKDKQQQNNWLPNVRSIVAIDGNAIRLDRRPNRDYAMHDEAWVQNSFPIIDVLNIGGVSIEDLVVDGNREQNRDNNLDGCRGGGIYFNEVRNCAIRRCIVRDYNGDGFSWQTTEDMVVEDCESYGNSGFGFHPGTGSPRTTVRNCRAHHNGTIGLFLCWGVRFGRFENNIIEDNGQYGISIGHKDTDNLFIGNQVRRNGVAGVQFRDEAEFNAGHRCSFKGNTIESNGRGGKGGIGVQILGHTVGTRLEGNVIRDAVAVDIGTSASDVSIAPDNRIEGEMRGMK